jgi:hypothetical protein
MATSFENLTAPTDSTEMARRALEPEQCALIVVDIQEKLLPPIWEKDRLVRNAQLLIRLAGILKIPALVTTQYNKGLGNTVPEVASLLPDTPTVDKLMFSCFGSDVFCSLLKRLPGQRTTVLLCNADRAGSAAGGLPCACSVRRGELAHRTELAPRTGAHARRRSHSFLDRNDDL